MPSPALAGPAPRPMPPSLPMTGMPANAYAIAPRTLLLVEDSRFAAEAVRLVCRRAGIRLRRADTLASAALHLKVYRPDIALVDLGLPDGSGLDLIAGLARLRPRLGRVVAISGDANLRDAALDAGADAFLLKPVSMAAHLAELTGEALYLDDSLIEIDAVPGPAALRLHDRNAGGDPQALRDDLRWVADLLNGRYDAERLHYAAQFLASVGRALRDDDLARDAEDAGMRGDRLMLSRLLRARLANAPLL